MKNTKRSFDTPKATVILLDRVDIITNSRGDQGPLDPLGANGEPYNPLSLEENEEGGAM